LETIGFADQPFDSIAVDGLFEIPAAGAKPRLKTSAGGSAPPAIPLLRRSQWRIIYPEGKKRKAFTFTEQPFDQFAALKPFLFAEREFVVADRFFLIREAISISIRRKQSACDVPWRDGWPTLYGHWPFACVYETRERSCGGEHAAEMCVSLLKKFYVTGNPIRAADKK
jgi:hypothetical protein